MRPLSPKPQWKGGGVWAEVTEIDRFGNIQLGVSFAQILDRLTWHHGDHVWVALGQDPVHTAQLAATFGELKSGDLGLLADSWGNAALACNQAAAAALLGVTDGAIVGLIPKEPSKGVTQHASG